MKALIASAVWVTCGLAQAQAVYFAHPPNDEFGLLNGTRLSESHVLSPAEAAGSGALAKSAQARGRLQIRLDVSPGCAITLARRIEAADSDATPAIDKTANMPAGPAAHLQCSGSIAWLGNLVLVNGESAVSEEEVGKRQFRTLAGLAPGKPLVLLYPFNATAFEISNRHNESHEFSASPLSALRFDLDY